MDVVEHAEPGSVQPRPRRRAVRARIARRRASHSYAFVLVLIVTEFVLLSALPNTSWARVVVLLLAWTVLGSAAWASGFAATARPVLALLFVAAAVVALVEIVVSGDESAGTVWVAGVVLLGGTAGMIVVGILDQEEVNTQSILGAICVYLLLGLLFTQLYGAVAALSTGPFFAAGNGDGTASSRLYFSFVTLATLGYGDLTPASTLGQTLAVFEALLGQLYLVTVVALLVSRVGRARSVGP